MDYMIVGTITGMLLEIDNSELLHMLEHKESLSSKVEEAVDKIAVLSAPNSQALELYSKIKPRKKGANIKKKN